MNQNTTSVADIVDRMKAVYGFKTDAELAAHFGGSRSGPSVWKKRGSIPFDECITIALERNISLDWLILGRGPGPGLLGQCDEAGDAAQATHVEVPVVDLPNFDISEMWKLPRAWLEREGLSIDDTMIVRIAGDAMADTLLNGQLVIVDRRPRDADGVFLVRFADRVRIKRVQRMVDGSTRLSSDNPAYAVETIPAGVDQVEFIGFCHSTVTTIR